MPANKIMYVFHLEIKTILLKFEFKKINKLPLIYLNVIANVIISVN